MLTSLTVLTRVQTNRLSYINTQNPEFSTSEDLLISKPAPPTTAAPFKNRTLNQQPTPVVYQSLNVWLFPHSHSSLHSTKYPQISERPSFSSPPAARQLEPSGRGLVPWGLFINKRPLFHTPLDVCRQAREAPTMSSTMLQWAAMTTKTKHKNFLFCVGFPYPETALNLLIIWSWAETPPIWQWGNVEAVRRDLGCVFLQVVLFDCVSRWRLMWSQNSPLTLGDSLVESTFLLTVRSHDICFLWQKSLQFIWKNDKVTI